MEEEGGKEGVEGQEEEEEECDPPQLLQPRGG